MRNKVISGMSLAALACLLGGCNQQQLDANIQMAAVISCLAADGAQVEYSVASAVVASEGANVGKTSQQVLNNSTLALVGSQTLCTSLSNLNAKLQASAPK